MPLTSFPALRPSASSTAELNGPLVGFVRGSRGVTSWLRGPLGNVGLLGLLQDFKCVSRLGLRNTGPDCLGGACVVGPFGA